MKTTMLAAYERWQKRPLPVWVSWAVFLLLPLLSALVWGGLLADDAFLSMRFAQTAARLEGFTAQVMVTSLGYTPLSPVSWLILAVPERLGWNVTFIATVLAALGWGVTAVCWQKLLRKWQLPVVDWLVPLLLLLSPIVVMTMGSFVSWFVALAWLAIWLTVQQRWLAQTIVMVLLLLVNVSITAVSLIIILLIWRIAIFFQRSPHAEAQRRREKQDRNLQTTYFIRTYFNWLVAGVLTGVFLLLVLGIGLQIKQMPWQVSFPFADWLIWGRQWLYAGEFVWLFVLFSLVAVVGRRQTWPIAIWLLFALLDVNEVGQTVLATGLLFLAGVGMALIAQWLVQKQWLDLGDNSVYLGAVVVLCIPFFWMMLSAAINRQNEAAVLSDRMVIGAWLRENSESDALIMSDPAMGYFAERTVWSWNGRSDQQNWADFIRAAGSVSPDYIVTNDTLFWDGLKHLSWWQDRYRLAQSFDSLDIWQYAPQPALTSDIKPLNVLLENGVKLVGYQQTPQSISPGDAVNLSLHFQMDEPIKYGFGTLVWLSAPLDGVYQALPDLPTPRAAPPNWWEPEQIVTEQFILTTTEQIPMGGYRLAVSFYTREGYGPLPAYQNNDSNPLDHIFLDYVAVPWTGVVAAATPFNNQFGYEFQLLAAKLPSAQGKRGDELEIQLFWEAVNPNRPQNNYTIFVHLLNEAGELVANADSPPQGGQYVTGAWVPGDVVPDTHRLMLPSDLEQGNYEIRVGAYVLETGERLPVFDEAGNEIPEGSLLLMQLLVDE